MVWSFSLITGTEPSTDAAQIEANKVKVTQNWLKRKSTSEVNHRHKEMCKWQRQGNSCCLDWWLFSSLTVLHSILFIWVCSVLAANSICQPHASLEPQQQSIRLHACGCKGCLQFLELLSLPWPPWLLSMAGTKWVLSLGNKEPAQIWLSGSKLGTTLNHWTRHIGGEGLISPQLSCG